MTDFDHGDIELSPLLEELAAEYAENPKSKKFLPLAEEYRKSKMYDEAIYFLTEGIKLYPDFTPAKITLARCYVDTEEWQDAFDILIPLNEGTPNNVPILRMMAETYWGLGDVRAAAETYKGILKLNPEDRVSQEKLGEIEADHGHHIDISSLDTPLIRPSAKEEIAREYVDTDEPLQEPEEEGIELDLDVDDQVDFDELTLPESQEEEIVEISLSTGDFSESAVTDGVEKFKDSVDENEDEDNTINTISSLELGNEEDSYPEDESEGDSLELNSDDLVASGVDVYTLDTDSDKDETPLEEDFPEDSSSEKESLTLESQLEDPDEEILELTIDDVVDGSKDDEDSIDSQSDQSDSESTNGESIIDLQLDSGNDLDDPFALTDDDLSSVEAALAFDSPDIMDHVEEEVTGRFRIDDVEQSTESTRQPEEEPATESADHAEVPDFAVRSLSDYAESEREELTNSILDLSLDYVEKQGQAPFQEDFSVVDTPTEASIDESETELDVHLEEAAPERESLFDDSSEQEADIVRMGDNRAKDHSDLDADIIPMTASSAKVFWEQGDLGKAREIYRSLIKANPEKLDYQQALDQLDAQLSKEGGWQPQNTDQVLAVLESWLGSIRKYKQDMESGDRK